MPAVIGAILQKDRMGYFGRSSLTIHCLRMTHEERKALRKSSGDWEQWEALPIPEYTMAQGTGERMSSTLESRRRVKGVVFPTASTLNGKGIMTPTRLPAALPSRHLFAPPPFLERILATL